MIKPVFFQDFKVIVCWDDVMWISSNFTWLKAAKVKSTWKTMTAYLPCTLAIFDDGTMYWFDYFNPLSKIKKQTNQHYQFYMPY